MDEEIKNIPPESNNSFNNVLDNLQKKEAEKK